MTEDKQYQNRKISGKALLYIVALSVYSALLIYIGAVCFGSPATYNVTVFNGPEENISTIVKNNMVIGVVEAQLPEEDPAFVLFRGGYKLYAYNIENFSWQDGAKYEVHVSRDLGGDILIVDAKMLP